MPVWSDCSITILDAQRTAIFNDDDCDVRADGDELIVNYFDDFGPVVYAGHADAAGAFPLMCRSRPRTAHLVWSEDKTRLEGTWTEGGESGTWTIALPSG